jgi:hypothetical protein
MHWLFKWQYDCIYLANYSSSLLHWFVHLPLRPAVINCCSDMVVCCGLAILPFCACVGASRSGLRNMQSVILLLNSRKQIHSSRSSKLNGNLNCASRHLLYSTVVWLLTDAFPRRVSPLSDQPGRYYWTFRTQNQLQLQSHGDLTFSGPLQDTDSFMLYARRL